ncbi:hypothetical protein FKP32DRAFT_1686963 [Trametes sanguinea]|nr:hypothetical protein FKP32DRAFT_1686963 [Trametes sanguinea]
MATRYRVFYGAPSAQDLRKPYSKMRWQTVTTSDARSGPLTLPPATLAAASRRISMMYENVIFGESQEDDEACVGDPAGGNEEPHPEGQTTLITWAPTTQGPDETSRSRAEVTFLRPSVTISYFRSQKETQESQETDSFNESNASSIAQFPAFHFSLHALTPLDTLISQAQAARAKGMPKASLKVCVLAAVLEVDGPDTIRIKKGADAGKEVSLLKLILGDESGGICKLAAWREIAEDWAGLNPELSAPSVKKGDIVLLETHISHNLEEEVDQLNDCASSGGNSQSSGVSHKNVVHAVSLLRNTCLPPGSRCALSTTAGQERERHLLEGKGRSARFVQRQKVEETNASKMGPVNLGGNR